MNNVQIWHMIVRNYLLLTNFSITLCSLFKIFSHIDLIIHPIVEMGSNNKIKTPVEIMKKIDVIFVNSSTYLYSDDYCGWSS